MSYTDGYENTYTIYYNGAVTATNPRRDGQITLSTDSRCPGTNPGPPCVRIEGTYEDGSFEFMTVTDGNAVKLSRYSGSGDLKSVLIPSHTTVRIPSASAGDNHLFTISNFAQKSEICTQFTHNSHAIHTYPQTYFTQVSESL